MVLDTFEVKNQVNEYFHGCKFRWMKMEPTWRNECGHFLFNVLGVGACFATH